MSHWLLKSEPDVFSFADLKARGTAGEPWNGVRNYQARNFMRDAMAPGDWGLFYESNCPRPGIAGLLRVASGPAHDPSQFDPQSPYHDPASRPENPRWMLVQVTWAADFVRFVSLADLRGAPELADLMILRRGNRLSITPVEDHHFARICQMGGISPP